MNLSAKQYNALAIIAKELNVNIDDLLSKKLSVKQIMANAKKALNTADFDKLSYAVKQLEPQSVIQRMTSAFMNRKAAFPAPDFTPTAQHKPTGFDWSRFSKPASRKGPFKAFWMK